jgi:hypothetical protein
MNNHGFESCQVHEYLFALLSLTNEYICDHQSPIYKIMEVEGMNHLKNVRSLQLSGYGLCVQLC